MVIGIGGISRGGKSFLAAEIKKALNHKEIIILHQDDYVFPENNIPKIRNHIDWESPLSINFDSFYSAIVQAQKKAEIIIAEGLFAFYSKEINKLYAVRFLVELPKVEFIKRKKKDRRWGNEEDWYIEHIWQSYLFYGKPVSDPSQPYTIIDGSQIFDMATIVQKINI